MARALAVECFELTAAYDWNQIWNFQLPVPFCCYRLVLALNRRGEFATQISKTVSKGTSQFRQMLSFQYSQSILHNFLCQLECSCSGTRLRPLNFFWQKLTITLITLLMTWAWTKSRQWKYRSSTSCRLHYHALRRKWVLAFLDFSRKGGETKAHHLMGLK